MKEFDQIYLSWRKGRGGRRFIVGLLKKDFDGTYKFSYDPANVDEASIQGFTPYTEFSDVNKVYNGTVLDVFAQRLIKAERPDIQTFYKFWEIDPEHQNNKFYLLGHTQGLLPTDNFEFLADYNIVEGLHFLTEVAGLTDNPLASDALNTGDILRFENDSANPFDKEAVKIFKGDLFIGYIKKIHCKIFYKPGADKLMLSVKAIEKNGVIKKVFVKIAV